MRCRLHLSDWQKLGSWIMPSGGHNLEKLEFQGPPCWRFVEWAAIPKSRTLSNSIFGYSVTQQCHCRRVPQRDLPTCPQGPARRCWLPFCLWQSVSISVGGWAQVEEALSAILCPSQKGWSQCTRGNWNTAVKHNVHQESRTQ